MRLDHTRPQSSPSTSAAVIIGDATFAQQAGDRIAVIDVLRGVAISAVVVYHIAWDLDAYGLTDADVTRDVAWVVFAHTIAGTFLALVGVNLVLATRIGFRIRPYLRRLAIIVLAAGLVSAGTYWFMPDAFVFFGILHEIAVASVLALPFVWAPVWVTVPAGIFFLVGRSFLTGPAFDAAPLLWIGLAERVPATLDYVPIFPWFGVVLLGVAAGHLIVRSRGMALWAWHPSGWSPRFLTVASRWSLPIYLMHQPVLLGLLFVLAP